MAERMTIAQALELGTRHHQAGNLLEAESIYRQILAVQPNNVDVLHLLGVLAPQAGDIDAGIELM